MRIPRPKGEKRKVRIRKAIEAGQYDQGGTFNVEDSRILAKATLVGAKMVKGNAGKSPALGSSVVLIASWTSSLSTDMTVLLSSVDSKPMVAARELKLSL